VVFTDYPLALRVRRGATTVRETRCGAWGHARCRIGNNDFSYFDDPAFNRELEAAAKLSGAKRYRAYARLGLKLERQVVPAAPFATDASRDFFSARIGCQTY
jgi:hypothetical protein